MVLHLKKNIPVANKCIGFGTVGTVFNSHALISYKGEQNKKSKGLYAYRRKYS